MINNNLFIEFFILFIIIYSIEYTNIFKQINNPSILCILLIWPYLELSNNLFYHLCYEGAVDMEKIHDLEERYALEVQIGEFGQVPKQLFASPHPARIIFEGKRKYNLMSFN